MLFLPLQQIAPEVVGVRRGRICLQRRLYLLLSLFKPVEAGERNGIVAAYIGLSDLS
jgi:hypothetical protein